MYPINVRLFSECDINMLLFALCYYVAYVINVSYLCYYCELLIISENKT